MARRVLMGCQWVMGTKETYVGPDGWCAGGLGHQRSDGGGYAAMRERPESVESPGTYCM